MTDSFYTQRKLTPIEQEIDYAIEDHRNARRDARQAGWAAFLLWLSALITDIGAEGGSRRNHISNALFACAVIMWLLYLFLEHRKEKYRQYAKGLVDGYLRGKALPFFKELTEMFADKPGVHLHLNKNGTIRVTDKRKEK